jgi:hypothetical protein
MKKKMILEGENSNPVEKSNFSICHFCRNYMDHKYMVKCNYKSSNMGLPVFAMPLPESTVFDSGIILSLIQDLPSRRVVIQ